jgi:hypothetical protein
VDTLGTRSMKLQICFLANGQGYIPRLPAHAVLGYEKDESMKLSDCEWTRP